MFQILEKLDIFGVPIKLKTLKQQDQFRTSQSGIITLIILLLSLLYFCFVIAQWIGGQLLPNVTISQSMIDHAVQEWDDDAISFVLYDMSTQGNPFQKKNNILMPVLFTMSGIYISEVPRILYSTHSSSEGHQSFISIDKGKLILNSVVNGTEPIVQYMLVFVKCREDWLSDGENCADNKTMSDYFSKNHGLLFMNVKLKQYNFTALAFDNFQKTQFFAFDLQNPLYSQIILQQQSTIIDDGILLNSYHNEDSLRDFSVNSQKVSDYYASSILRGSNNTEITFASHFSFVFRIDNIKTFEVIVMPKLGQVLAQIGSIVNIIMLLKILANIINVTLLENSTLHQIIEIYYPEMKQVFIEKNLIGQFKRVTYKGQEIKLQTFQQKYNELRHIAMQKLTFNNLIYELSRVQLILIKQLGIEKVKQLQLIDQEELQLHEEDCLIKTRQHNGDSVVVVAPEQQQNQQFQRITIFNYDD